MKNLELYCALQFRPQQHILLSLPGVLLQIGTAVGAAGLVLTCLNEFGLSNEVYVPNSWYSIPLHCIQQYNLLCVQLCSL